MRTVKISFCNAIPRSLIFLFAQRVSYLAAFDGMPAKFLGWIHGRSPVQEFPHKFAVAEKVPDLVRII